jgi:acetoin utilization deacetylase AcuC-like enzyme
MPQRIAKILSILAENRVLENMTKLAIRPVRQDEVLMIHSPKHWEKVEAIQCQSTHFT